MKRVAVPSRQRGLTRRSACAFVASIALGPLAALAVSPARASQAASRSAPPEVTRELPGARLQGEARLRWMGLRVYDARLWVAGADVGADWAAVERAAAPLALEIEYARALDGERIAERSLAEMRRQGDIAPELAERWLDTMRRLFPDVAERDRITGVLLPPGRARFFVNARPAGEVQDAEFARRFFGIWLAPQTSEPALRRALLGEARQ